MNKLKALIARRADLKSRTRQFFADRGVLEADVPALGEFGVTDVHIDCIPAKVNGSIRYLQSSPEYAMKRLLAEGSGAVYSLNYAYRDGEQGPRHRPEFVMLEWYRPGWDEHRLMDELAALCEALEIVSAPLEKLTYGEVFESACGLNPHRAETGELQKIASDVSRSDFSAESRSTCLDLIFTLLVEPQLPKGLVFIHQYPSCQSALAQAAEDENGDIVARRFEAFIDRMELANGYFEITDASELRHRFEADRAARRQAGKPDMAIDFRLLEAMQKGLPECAGVALGFDRLVMSALGVENIADAVLFP